MLVALLAVLFFLIPFAEIFVIVQMSAVFGNINTLLLLLMLSSAGAWLVKREGIASWRKVIDGVKAGRIPTAHVVDGFVLMIAGVLLLTPGFVTGVFGLVLAVPPVREVVRGIATDRVKSKMVSKHRAADASAGAPFGAPRAGQAGQSGPFGGGQRAYRRPDETATRPSGRSSSWTRDDIIDVEGEEWYLDEEPLGEIGPPAGG